MFTAHDIFETSLITLMLNFQGLQHGLGFRNSIELKREK